ncbi:MAG: hypothetical protein L3K19_05600 [Thermoplasmata archaeon]|nr:hypothetical protein [Thermoplasmata archaeon]
MRHRKPRGKPILVCPQCYSMRLIYDAGLITGQRYHCLRCDYVGSLVLEFDDLAQVPPEKAWK